MVICPHLICLRGDKILLLKRADSAKIMAGHWHCPTGTIEERETPLQAIVREAYEEVGVHVSDLKYATSLYIDIVSWCDPTQRWQDLSVFFVANFEGLAPYNVEPEKHPEMEWFPVRDLPLPMIPVVQKGIDQYLNKIPYGEMVDK